MQELEPNGHPAVAAWLELRPEAPPPSKLELIYDSDSRKSGHKAGEGRAVFRLHAVGPQGDPVVAKRVDRRVGQAERLAYTVLDRCGLQTGACLGLLDADDGNCWLFIQDAGDVAYSPERDQDRAAASRWLARLHRETSGSPFLSNLRDRGEEFYRRLLLRNVAALRTNLVNPRASSEERETLRELACLSDHIDSNWRRITDPCAEMAPTIIHGGLLERNLRMRGGELVAFDWEHSGRGVPAVDLAMLLGSLGPLAVGEYCRAVRGAWPRLKTADVTELIHVGRLFRLIQSVGWDALHMSPRWFEKPIQRLKVYRSQLAHLVAARFS